MAFPDYCPPQFNLRYLYCKECKEKSSFSSCFKCENKTLVVLILKLRNLTTNEHQIKNKTFYLETSKELGHFKLNVVTEHEGRDFPLTILRKYICRNEFMQTILTSIRGESFLEAFVLLF